jgi:hypothetical protein
MLHFLGKNINETTAFGFNSKGIVVAHYKTNDVASNPLLKLLVLNNLIACPLHVQTK